VLVAGYLRRVHVRVAGVGSTLPTASMARTPNVCVPKLTSYDLGEVQVPHAPPSSWHWNVEPASDEENEKVAVGAFVFVLGADTIVVLGGVESTVHARVAGVGSALPTGSTARTSTLCEPSARPEYAFGDEHGAQAPPSRRHSNVAPESDDEKVRLAVVDVVVPDGPDSSVVSGAVVSGGGGVPVPWQLSRPESVEAAPSPRRSRHW
jgi:hypothetical protein